MSAHRTPGSRGSHLRLKVFALLLSMASLWAFAAFVTIREGFNLLWVNTLTQHVGKPTEALLDALQHERHDSVVYLAARGDRTEQSHALSVARQQTDRERARFTQQTGDSSVSSAASATLRSRISEARHLLGRLPQQRQAIDVNSTSVTDAATMYTDLIDAGFQIYGSISGLDDPDIAKQSRTLVALSRAREVLSDEDALLAGALARGRFAGTEHIRFIQLVGIRRVAYAQAATDLPDPERAAYNALITDAALSALRVTEDRLIDNARAGEAPAVDSATWSATVTAAAGKLRAFELSSAQATLDRAVPAAVGVVVRLVLAGGLGLLAVIASIIVSITTARSLVRQLIRLRDAARELADERLPAVVEQLSRGDVIDVDAQAPPLQFGNDEIGQVGQAFNAVQRTAVQAAVEQADLRRSIRDVYLSLARRTQALVHRQLNLLDTMERQETDADELAVLFRLDHLATRMRRNAENLIVLSGAASGRRWRQSVPMVDVVRGSVAEVEDYTRVQVLPMAQVGLEGRAVGDVIHLLAELVENAVAFSPPQTAIQIGGQLVGNGFAVEVEDRGLGMSDEMLNHANEQLANPPDFHLTSTARLGLFVVGRLAQRHGIRVRLRGSPYGGTTAIVLIPSNLVTADLPAETNPRPLRTVERARDPRIDADGIRPAVGADEPLPALATTGDGLPPHGPRPDLVPAAGHRPATVAEPTIATEPMLVREPVARTESITATEPMTATEPVIPVEAMVTTESEVAAEPMGSGEPAKGTIFGLPRRQRLAARAVGVSAARATVPGTAAKSRSPEAAWMLMSSYQSGTRQGRAAAARLPEPSRSADPADPAPRLDPEASNPPEPPADHR